MSCSAGEHSGRMQASVAGSWRRAERKAAARTARAEASLTRTEQQIHQLADETRHDLNGSV